MSAVSGYSPNGLGFYQTGSNTQSDGFDQLEAHSTFNNGFTTGHLNIFGGVPSSDATVSEAATQFGTGSFLPYLGSMSENNDIQLPEAFTPFFSNSQFDTNYSQQYRSGIGQFFQGLNLNTGQI